MASKDVEDADFVLTPALSMLKCFACGEDKALLEFSASEQVKGDAHRLCRDCSEAFAPWPAESIDKFLAYFRAADHVHWESTQSVEASLGCRAAAHFVMSQDNGAIARALAAFDDPHPLDFGRQGGKARHELFKTCLADIVRARAEGRTGDREREKHRQRHMQLWSKEIELWAGETDEDEEFACVAEVRQRHDAELALLRKSLASNALIAEEKKEALLEEASAKAKTEVDTAKEAEEQEGCEELWGDGEHVPEQWHKFHEVAHCNWAKDKRYCDADPSQPKTKRWPRRGPRPEPVGGNGRCVGGMYENRLGPTGVPAVYEDASERILVACSGHPDTGDLDLDEVRAAWAALGSPCLRGTRFGPFAARAPLGSPCPDTSFRARKSPLEALYEASCYMDGDVSEHVAFLQRAGCKFDEDLEIWGSLTQLLRFGFRWGADLSGMDLTNMACLSGGNHDSGELSLAACIFSRDWGAFRQGDLFFTVKTLFSAGADMWPLGLPGVTAECPPTFGGSAAAAGSATAPASSSSADDDDDDDDEEDGEEEDDEEEDGDGDGHDPPAFDDLPGGARYQMLSILWPNTFPYRSSGVQVASGSHFIKVDTGKLLRTVRKAKSLGARRTLTHRKEWNWARRSLVLMCCLRGAEANAAKKSKGDEAASALSVGLFKLSTDFLPLLRQVIGFL